MSASKTTHFWVFKTKAGTYYRDCTRGSWSKSLNQPQDEEYQTTDLFQATRFQNKPEADVPIKLFDFAGGRWVEMVEDIAIYPAIGGH